MRPIVRHGSGEKGFAMVAYAAMIVGVIGFTGLAVDVGYLQYEKRRIQSAADAGAMGALREMERGNTDLVAAGRNDSSLNGFTDGVSDTSVTINNPPTSGSYNGVSTAVQAIVTRTVPTFFMQIFGQNGVMIAAQAVAQTSTSAGSIGGCIFALNRAAGNTLVVSGSATVTSACSAVVNSGSSQAFVQSGGTTIFELTNNAKVGVAGNWTISGGAQLLYSGVTGTPVTIQHFSDPLAGVAEPTTPVTGGVQSTDTLSISSTSMPAGNVLNPGVYCNGIKISGTNGTTLTFNPGLYIIAGGGLTASSNAVTIAGTGVSFYNTTESTSWGCPKSNNAGPITISGGATANLSAPTTGSPIGILFFEDRSLSNLNNAISGNSAGDFNGALYFFGSKLTFSGASTTNLGQGYLVIVADTIAITGASNLGNDHTSLANVFTLAPTTTGGGLVQ